MTYHLTSSFLKEQCDILENSLFSVSPREDKGPGHVHNKCLQVTLRKDDQETQKAFQSHQWAAETCKDNGLCTRYTETKHHSSHLSLGKTANKCIFRNVLFTEDYCHYALSYTQLLIITCQWRSFILISWTVILNTHTPVLVVYRKVQLWCLHVH